MRRLIVKNGREVYTWDDNEKGDNELTTVIDVVAEPIVEEVINTEEVITEDVKKVLEVIEKPIIPHPPTTPEEIIDELITPDFE